MFDSKKMELLKRDVRVLELQMKQLRCPHKNIVFRSAVENFHDGRDPGNTKTCKDCDEVLEKYSDEEKMNQAKIEYYEEQIKLLRQE